MRALTAAAAVLLTFTPSIGAATDTPEEAALRAQLRQYTTGNPNFVLPPYSAKLDDAYARADWVAFWAATDEIYGKAKTATDIFLMMNWEKYRLFDGGGYPVAKLYAVDSWNIALSYEKAGSPQAPKMKQRALANNLYALGLVIADGVMCTDGSAVAGRMEDQLRFAAQVWTYAWTLTPEERQWAIDEALKEEKAIAPLRKNDDALCRSGNDEAKYVREHKLRPTIMTDQSGERRSILPPSDYHPTFNKPENWLPKREEMRQTLRPQMRKLLKLDS